MSFDGAPQTLRDQLKAWRQAQGLSMKAAAKLLGLGSASAYQYYETGSRRNIDDLPKRFRDVLERGVPSAPDAKQALAATAREVVDFDWLSVAFDDSEQRKELHRRISALRRALDGLTNT